VFGEATGGSAYRKVQTVLDEVGGVIPPLTERRRGERNDAILQHSGAV
jgi:hypothetical protein